MDAENVAKLFAYAAGSAAALPASLLSLYFLAYLSCRFSQRVTSEEELERIVGEEAKKLGIKEPIKVVLQENFLGGQTSRIPEGYLIEIGRKDATRMLLRHEFGHIRQGNVGRGPEIPVLDFFYRFLWKEPRAIAYQYRL